MSHQPFSREELLLLSKEQLVEIILRLEARLIKLEMRLGIDSTTSSKPPASDLLTKSELPKPATPDAPPKRKAGGQVGHKGSTRKGFGKAARFELLRPNNCSYCGSEQLQTTDILERQAACLAERPIEIVSFSRHTCVCEHCHKTTIAPWPKRLTAGSDIDIGLQAMLVWLGNYGQLSYEKQAEWVETLCGWRPSVGTLATVNAQVAKAVSPAMQDAWQVISTAPTVYVDGTPWPVIGCKEWLWHFGTEALSLFHAGQTRGRIEVETRLGSSFAGCLVSDDFSVYNGYAAAMQQKCLAHLRRHFKKIEKLSKTEPVGLARTFIGLIDEGFRRYSDWQASGEDGEFALWAGDFRERVNQQIKQWLPKAGYEAGKLLRSLRDKAEQVAFFNRPDSQARQQSC